jgi:hypothetical protein
MTLCLFIFQRYPDQVEDKKDRVRTRKDPDIHSDFCANEITFLLFEALNRLSIQEKDQ